MSINKNVSSQIRIESSQPPFIPTELPSKRSAFGKVFAVGAGKYKAFQSAMQIHRLDGETREWTEIDARFRPAEKPEEDFGIPKPLLVSCGALLTAACGSGGDRPFICVADESGNKVSWGMEGALSARPEAFEDPADEDEKNDPALAVFRQAQRGAEGAVLYREIFPGVNMTCRSGSRFKEELTFASPESVREIICLLQEEIAFTSSSSVVTTTIFHRLLYQSQH